MQDLGKFIFKINFIPNGLEKYMNFNINDKLIFIDSFQFLSSLFDTLVRNLSKNDFIYFIQDFDSNVLVIAKQKGFYSFKYMSDFEKFKEKLLSTKNFYGLLTGEILMMKIMSINVWKTFEMKQ